MSTNLRNRKMPQDATMLRTSVMRRVSPGYKKCWPITTFAAALLLVFSSVLSVYAAPGDLDTTFSGNGKVSTDFNNQSYDSALAVAIQPDGKIVAAGYSDSKFALARYNTNGSLDSNFNGDGLVTTAVLGDYDNANAVAIQSNGKIVAGGLAYDSSAGYYDFALARYNPDGSLDTSFSGNGKVVTDFGGFAAVYGLAIQTDGKIVAAGHADTGNDEDFALARYNTNGSLDTTFSGDGKVITGFGSQHETAFAVSIQTNGKIVAAGYTGSISSADFALARYNTNGNLDTTFSFDGKLTTDFAGSDDNAFALALQSDGKIIAAGIAIVGSSVDFALARYTLDGILDTTFSGNGKVTTDFGAHEFAYGLATQSNGKIVAVGMRRPLSGSEDNFALARYNPNGSLDTTFSGDGKVTTDFAGYPDHAYAVALQSNGKIVVAGDSQPGANTANVNFAVARYDGDPVATPTPIPTHTPLPTQTAGGPSATPIPSDTPTATDTPVPTDTPIPSPTACPITFTDVPQGSTFYSYIRCLACRSIVNGYADGTFKPNNNVTRGQLAKIVSNAAGFQDPQDMQLFEDVPRGSTFFTFVDRLASRGYMSGYACGSPVEPCGEGNLPYFRPNNNATRGQISKIVSNAAGFNDPAGAQVFEDVPSGSTFYDFVQRLASRSIMGGYLCGAPGEPCNPPGNRPYFRPNNNATRGQTSKIVSNTFFPDCQTPSRK